MDGGTLAGKSLDPMGLSSRSIDSWQRNFDISLREFKDAIDDHFVVNNTTSQKMKDYLNKVGNKVYSKTSKPGGHFLHENILIKVNPQPSSPDLPNGFVLKGSTYKIKGQQTQLNPIWTETEIIHEFAYTLSRKKNPVLSDKRLGGWHGRTDPCYETSYESALLDGTEIKVKHVNYHRYNLQSTLVHDKNCNALKTS